MCEVVGLTFDGEIDETRVDSGEDSKQNDPCAKEDMGVNLESCRQQCEEVRLAVHIYMPYHAMLITVHSSFLHKYSV